MRGAALALLLAGCGGGSTSGGADLAPADCPNDLPSSCPTPAPSWDGGVAALVSAVCTPCHRPGGQAFDHPLTNYAQVYDLRVDVLDQVYSCYMPPPDAGTPLGPSQRQALLGWLVCGAPNN